MTEDSFFDIEDRFNLQSFKRNLDTQTVKASKYYWNFACIYFCSNQDFEPPVLTNTYADIFYRPLEIKTAILDNFSGNNAKTLNSIDYILLEEHFRKKIFEGISRLISYLKKLLVNNPQNFFQIAPENVDIVDLTFLDQKQPYLPSPSSSFKQILGAANYTYKEDVVLCDISFLRPSTVHELNGIMDHVIQAEAFFHSVSYLKNFLGTTHDNFSTKVNVNSPTDALHSAISLAPEILSFTTNQIAYQLKLKYVNESGEMLNDASLKKAIVRYKSSNV